MVQAAVYLLLLLFMSALSQIAFDFDETPNQSKPVETVVKKRGRKPSGRPAKPKQKRGRKNLKEAASEAEMIELPTDEELSKKLYYSISEVSDLFKLNPSSLRFWESEFSIIKPRKNKKGDRFYNAGDIKKLHLIYYLLRIKKYSIEAAKDYIKNNSEETDKRFELVQSLQQLKAFLLSIKADL